MSRKWDFSGWATKANIKCSDGRTIKKDAFKGCDGMEVPLVWNHQHNDPSEILGHALLENRDEGVYAYCSFNDTESGKQAKELVKHGDIKALSIYANQLLQTSKTPPCDVIHGTIREVSLVLAGANIGAYIDNVMIHGEIAEDQAEIFHGEDEEGFYFYHAEDDAAEQQNSDSERPSEKTVSEILDGLSNEQKAAVGVLIENIIGKKNLKHADKDDDEDEDEEDVDDADDVDTTDEDDEEDMDDEDTDDEDDDEKDTKMKNKNLRHADEEKNSEETVGDVLKTLTPKQRKVVEFLIGRAVSDNKKDNNEDESDKEDKSDMKHNVFENNEQAMGPIVSYEDQAAVIKHAFETRSTLKNTIMDECREGGVLAHAITDHEGNSITYGIANIDYLFPDARAINNTPEMVMNDQTWVNKVMNGTHHTPFARVKSLYADITGEDARARGYVKGNQKVEEVIEVLQREVNPQTIYKKQKLDRDDVIDITDFDVVAWLKAEMQIMLKAEIARAILIGDGRAAGTDKIKETCIIPVASDADVYTVKVPVTVDASAKADDISDAIIDAVILSRKQYKGSGNPSFFINEDYLSHLLLLKDGMGRRIYETEASLAAALRVKELIPVDVMENQTVKISGTDKPLIGVIVNLQDYNVGTNRGGATQFFDDFDIDFNQMKYLYETRLSGALVKPYSAMTVYLNQGA